MDWAAVITFIIQQFGPMIAKWLAAWLEDLLNKTAADMPAVVHGTEAEAGVALLDAALASGRVRGPARRALVRGIRRSLANSTQLDADELGDLALAAGDE